MNVEAKVYEVVIWSKDPDAIGRRISVDAKSIEDANMKIRELYGEDCVFFITNAEDAQKPR